MEKGAPSTLQELFESRKEILIQKLTMSSSSFKQENIETIIRDFMISLPRLDGSNTSLLTQVEQDIYDSMLGLTNIYANIIMKTTCLQVTPQSKEIPSHQRIFSLSLIIALILALVGGCVVGFFCKQWVAGLCCFIVICVSHWLLRIKVTNKEKVQTQSFIDVNIIVEQVREICKQIDSVLDIYRYQTGKRDEKYQKELDKPFEERYHYLLQSIQSLIGYERYKQESPDYVEELRERHEDLVMELGNHELSFVDYDESNANLFDLIETEDITSVVKTYPAIIKKGKIVLKGRVFIPQK